MFSNFAISALFSLGAGAWIYNKMMKNSGSQTKVSVIVGVVSGLIIFIALLVILGYIFKK